MLDYISLESISGITMVSSVVHSGLRRVQEFLRIGYSVCEHILHFPREAIHNYHQILNGVHCSVNRQILKVLSSNLIYRDLGIPLALVCGIVWYQQRTYYSHLGTYISLAQTILKTFAALVTWYIVPSQSGDLRPPHDMLSV